MVRPPSPELMDLCSDLTVEEVSVYSANTEEEASDRGEGGESADTKMSIKDSNSTSSSHMRSVEQVMEDEAIPEPMIFQSDSPASSAAPLSDVTSSSIEKSPKLTRTSYHSVSLNDPKVSLKRYQEGSGVGATPEGGTSETK